MIMRAVPPPLVDTLWTLLCGRLSLHMDAVLALVATVIAADSPRAKKDQRAVRLAASRAMIALNLTTIELDGVRVTLADAPTVTVEGETLITGASRLRVSFNAKGRAAAKTRATIVARALQPSPVRGMLAKPRERVATVIDMAEARERAAKRAVSFTVDMEYAADVEREILAARRAQ